MTLNKINLAALMIVLIMSTVLSAQSSYKIVVNSDNPVSSLSKNQVQRFFLKKATQWEDGTQIKPVDQKSSSAVRVKFTKDVLNKSVSAVKSYWQGQIFSGAGLPPQEVNNNTAVLQWVKSNPGGIGYIAQSASVTVSGVKVVPIK